MRMLLVSEGPSDVGDPKGDRVGAVREIVRRFLGRLWNREVALHEFETERLPRLHVRADEREAHGYEKKVAQTIRIAQSESCTCVAIVIDRDGPRNAWRLRELQAGRARPEQQRVHLAAHTSVGVAVETMEAWLLADERAVNVALEPEPRAAACNPEALDGPKGSADHPKACFLHHVENAQRECEDPVTEVARQLDLDVLAQRCAQGFAPFAAELRNRAV